MTALDSALDAALALDRVLVFGAAKIVLPSATLRLLDGSGVVTFGGETFTGIDPVFGAIDTIESLADGTGDEVPAFAISLFPPTDTAAATLAAANMQGAAVTLYIGAIDPATGLTIGTPNAFFVGEVDVPTLAAGAAGRRITYEVVSAMERLFSNDEGARLVDGYHQSIWPGETGFFDVTGIEGTVYWGVEPPKAAVAYGSGGGSNGATYGDGAFVRNQ